MVRRAAVRRAAALVAATVVGATALSGCVGASGEQVRDFVAVHKQHMEAAADVMQLFPDAQWTAKQRVSWCERPDGPYNVPPRTRVYFEMRTPDVGGGADVEQYPVSPEHLTRVVPQILEIFADAGWDAEDFSDDTRGSFQIGGSEGETYQTSFFVTVTEDGIQIKGRTQCVIGDRGTLEAALREVPPPWDDDVLELPVHDQGWAVD